MNKIPRKFGLSLLVSTLALGGTALTAGAASADDGQSKVLHSSNSSHSDHDHGSWEHDSRNGYWDGYGRFHNKHDHHGWRDDNNNWRGDDDYNGRWHGGDGCDHDRHGHWDHDGHYHHDR
ncbi:hypothetical protein ACFFGR_13990 [Arthrobacter liuii]|uniref:Uncharacterized protein n=1 Tax=Arthrobacter liuii TaxID=1476996 RepID=A0ABQ2B0I5_9MICC|nr:hypothetical protein [Arthrobacter liuii]GGI00208.1 hypothetical protein GCM10007170_36820 [Arthrobacter liuii]